MPDCLEKSLYKLNYFTEVLKAKAKDDIFKEKDLQIAILENISTIENQFKEEAFSK
jgi:hypothetical protein